MDAAPSPHPAPETLCAYGLGELDDASAQTVREHLEHCPDCRRQVAEMLPAGFAGDLRDAQEGSGMPDSDGAIASGPQTESPVADGITVDISSSPCMSGTGQVDATSEARNSPGGPSLQAGTLIGYFGDYELQNVLGEGGMGIAYKARQLSLNRPVALKMIKSARFASADDVRRFQNESEAVARLDHPNIVPIFEVGQFQDQHYFSMKLIAGESLDKRPSDYLAKPRQAAELVAVTASAIHHAHQRGILHRDLKPANILLDAEGRPHVTDFGLAKRVEGDSELTRSGAILGTPAYMAPEQASGKRGAVTTATDVYGLGALLYVLLTGRAPFGGDSVIDTLEQVRARLPEPPSKRNARVPRDLEVICLKCLEKGPHRRYASADALAEDLRHWLAGEPIAARPVGNFARFLLWSRRNPAVAGAAGLVVAALMVVAVLSLLYADRQARLARTVKLRADEQTQFANKQAADAAKISAQDHDLKASLADTNRRLAMLQFERAQRAFESGQANHGLLWLVETWRYAIRANDPAWQNLARTNLSFWRYNNPEIKGVFSEFVAIDPGGKMIVTRRGETIAQLWDVATCRPIGEPMVHPTKVEDVAFSPDNKTILTSSYPRTAQLWDAKSGHPIGKPMENDYSGHPRTASGHSHPASFSPDGKTVFTHDEGWTVRLWDAATGRPIGSPMECDPSHLAWFSSDGKAFHTGAGRRWDTASGKSLGALTLEHSSEAHTIQAVSPDGKSVLAADRSGKTYRLWDAVSGQFVGEPMVHKRVVEGAAFSADGRTIATVGSEMFKSPLVQLWDAATGSPIGSPSAHDCIITEVSFSPDGKTVAASFPFEGKVRLLDAGTGLPVGKVLEHQGPIVSVAFSPDGKTVLTASEDRTARLWDVATCVPLGEPMVHEVVLQSATFCADGSVVLTEDAGGTARLWKLFTDRPMGQPLELLDLALHIEFSIDGKTLRMTTGNDDEAPRLWDAATGSPIAERPPNQRNGAGFQFRPDAVKFIELSADNAARLWDGATDSPTGKVVGEERVSGSKTIAPNGASARRVFAVHSRDGTSFLTLAAAGAGAAFNALRLWNAARNQPIGQPIALQFSRCTGFSSDMKTILLAGVDHRARLWDAMVARAIGPPLRHPAEGPHITRISAAYSPDGKTIATSDNNMLDKLAWRSANSTVRLWHLPSTLDDDFLRMEAWVQTITGLATDVEGNTRALYTDAWQERREKLQQLGGPPKSDPGWLFDPILYGLDPTARGRAWAERKCWVEAEDAYSDVVRARPLRSSAWRERARFYVMRSDPEKAAGDFLKVLTLGDRTPQLFSEIFAGDGVVDRMLTHYPEDASVLSIDFLFRTAYHFVNQGRFDEARAALVRVVSPSAVADWAVPVGLPRPGATHIRPEMKPAGLNALGAALYRTGRFEDGIRRLKEGIEARKEAEQPLDWIFLALAYHGIGHRDEARYWLDRLRARQPSNDRDKFWEELAIRLLLSEAEAVILYDPVFPSNPFAF
jgi:WD40 repeat protein/tetratricopeptide (TPR) repeat protein